MHGIGLSQAVKPALIASGDPVDLAGFEGVVFIALANSNLQAKHGDASGSLSNIGSVFAATAGGVLEVHKPRKRYVTATSSSGGLIAIKYGARTLPANDPNNSVTLISPEE